MLEQLPDAIAIFDWFSTANNSAEFMGLGFSCGDSGANSAVASATSAHGSDVKLSDVLRYRVTAPSWFPARIHQYQFYCHSLYRREIRTRCRVSRGTTAIDDHLDDNDVVMPALVAAATHISGLRAGAAIDSSS